MNFKNIKKQQLVDFIKERQLEHKLQKFLDSKIDYVFKIVVTATKGLKTVVDEEFTTSETKFDADAKVSEMGEQFIYKGYGDNRIEFDRWYATIYDVFGGVDRVIAEYENGDQEAELCGCGRAMVHGSDHMCSVCWETEYS